MDYLVHNGLGGYGLYGCNYNPSAVRVFENALLAATHAKGNYPTRSTHANNRPRYPYTMRASE
jgi:hypothetical protein